MGKVINVIFRIVTCVLGIHIINLVLQSLQIALLVGINGYTVVLAAILGLPGILGLYVLLYLM